MDTAEALAVLGLSPGASGDDVRAAYLRLVRLSHPDLNPSGRGPGPDTATRDTARITQAYSLIRDLLAASGATTVTVPRPPAPPAPPGRDAPPTSRPWPYDSQAEATEAALVDHDTIAIAAPADEAFAALFEAAGRVGHLAYFDRQLGILETIVRFEGGPSCSVLITLQGRALVTEAFCTMESIEAAPTPPIRPVVEAIVEELVNPSPEA